MLLSIPSLDHYSFRVSSWNQWLLIVLILLCCCVVVFFKIAWPMLVTILFYKNFRTKLSIYTQKQFSVILMQLVLYPCINLGRNNLTLSLLIHKYWISAPLLESYFDFCQISNIQILHILSDLHLNISCFCATINGTGLFPSIPICNCSLIIQRRSILILLVFTQLYVLVGIHLHSFKRVIII